jgi:hypothetical protein
LPDDDISWTWREGIKVGRNEMRDQIITWAQEQHRLAQYEPDNVKRETELKVWDKVLDKLIFKKPESK